MTDDLTTLLRDAGREPTIDLDVDAVHSRGRRRAVGRTVATGIGALAVLGVIGLGVATLLDTPEAPMIDQTPGEDAAPAEDGSDHAQDRFSPTAAMADLGVTAVDLVRSQDGAGGLHVRVVTSEGVVEEFGTAAGALPPQLSKVVVTEDRRLWFTDADPNLLVGGPDDSLGEVVLQAQDGVGWVVLGESEAGHALIAPAVGPDGQFTGSEVQNVFVLEVDTAAEGNPGTVTGISGIDAGPVLAEAVPVAADAVPEHLALLTTIGESSSVTWFRAGDPEPRTLAETGGADSWFTDVAFVDDEVWVVAREDGVTNLWITRPDDHVISKVPTPAGRSDNVTVEAIEVEDGPDGPVVVLSTMTTEGGHGPAWLVDVDAARQAATDVAFGPDTEVPTGIYDVLDAAGAVHLLPPPSDDGPLAACATDEDGRINQRPSFPAGHVWFLCWDAVNSLEEAAHPFVATERFTGAAAGRPDPTALLVLLDAWADGPNEAEAAAGLTGGLEPEVATIEGVDIRADGEDGLVEVDVAAGPQVGVLSTTTGGATFVQAVVGMVVQYEGLDRVRFTLDGSCEDWAALVEALECLTYDESHAPWSQGEPDGDTLASDLDDGRHAVYLREVDTDGRTLTVDVIQFLTGKEASAAWDGDEGGPPNDYVILNESDQLRTLTVAADVAVATVFGDGDVDLDPSSWAELPDYLAQFDGWEGPELHPGPWWIELVDGVVAVLEEQYVP